MSGGFFTAAQVESTAPVVEYTRLQCHRCRLHAVCKSPKLPVCGAGARGVLLVVHGPSASDDAAGRLLRGAAGSVLENILASLGVDLHEDCWVTGATLCAKPDGQPSDDQIAYCRPALRDVVAQLKPRVIIPLGLAAVKSVLGLDWKDSFGELERWVGWRIPSGRYGAWVCPTYAPDMLRDDFGGGDVLAVWFKRHLSEAMAAAALPAPVVVDYAARVRRVMDHEQAASMLRVFHGQPFAFDYETNAIKPDAAGCRIWSAAISNGRRTLAFPWWGAAREEFGRLLLSDVPKVAANLKMEDRWTRAEFRDTPLVDGVPGWAWDTMQSAHVSHNRKGVTGLKFQAFVRLGCGTYNDKVDKYLEDTNDDGFNRIKEIPLPDLLLYNGMDAAVTWDVAAQQAAAVGVTIQ